MVNLVGGVQGLALSGNSPLLDTSFQVELHVPIHPMYPFVIPRLLVFEQPLKALQKVPAWPLVDDGVKGVNHRRNLDCSVHCELVTRRPRVTHDPASFDTRQSVRLHRTLKGRRLGCLRWNFRDITSLMTMLFRASSAYMRLGGWSQPQGPGCAEARKTTLLTICFSNGSRWAH